jgi:glutamate-1-semialdehyde 2,1-aminomutase
MSSSQLFTEALKYIPGGVNSPVRACAAVGGRPRFAARGEGAYIFDEDGRKYIDFTNSWGPLILGHAPKLVIEAISRTARLGTTFGAPTARETKLAETVSRLMPQVPMIRLVSSGTEAAMSAVRLARGASGRDLILKFTGCYHGHADSLLVSAGSGLATLSLPGSLGVPKALAELTLTCPFNDSGRLKALLEKYGGQLAAVITEIVPGNMGLVLPKPDFLETLAGLSSQGILLIADEVITGFRLGLGGAQDFYKIKPDLTVLGKILGGGLPLAAFGGRADLMNQLAPAGGVYQAGTLSGNPLAVAAGLAVLDELELNPEIYFEIAALTEQWTQGLEDRFRKKGIPSYLSRIGSMSTVFFASGPVENYEDAQKSDLKLFSAYWRAMLDEGIWLPPSQFETAFLSAAFTEDTVAEGLEKADRALAKI